ncbi:MAG: heme-binding protein [Desulfuromonas sp.]|nr:MAG: heme-binding protein [Desulfuromonas sp.]
MHGFCKVLIFAVILVFSGDLALAYEEPRYSVVQTYDDFELRQYEPFIVAEIVVDGAFDEVGGQAFRGLFAYISEDERPQGKIAMTAPVIQQPVPKETTQEKTRSTQEPEKPRYRFAFVMPAQYRLEDLPLPKSAEIQIDQKPVRLMAVRRYSGTWSEERYRENEHILMAALAREGMRILGEPIFARYNAPFSLWFLRRNEVLIEVQLP